MKVSVRGGTSHSSTDLCAKCRHSIRIKDVSDKVKTTCTRLDFIVQHAIVECSVYEDKSSPDLYDMKQIAWVLLGDPKEPIGFKPVKSLTDEERKKLGLEPF